MGIILGYDTASIASLGTDLISTISTEDLAALNLDQIVAFTAAIAGLTTSQTKALTTGRAAQLNIAQVASLTSGTVMQRIWRGFCIAQNKQKHLMH